MSILMALEQTHIFRSFWKLSWDPESSFPSLEYFLPSPQLFAQKHFCPYNMFSYCPCPVALRRSPSKRGWDSTCSVASTGYSWHPLHCPKSSFSCVFVSAGDLAAEDKKENMVAEVMRRAASAFSLSVQLLASWVTLAFWTFFFFFFFTRKFFYYSANYSKTFSEDWRVNWGDRSQS